MLRRCSFARSLAAAAMTADFVEHVISYWVIFQKVRAPWLGGFAVVSHWLLFLLLSMPAGALGDRFDTRRIIQIGMALFMCVSIAWGVLFYTDTLEIWHAGVLLVVHGLAGVLWQPSVQLLHDMVGTNQLPSAVRLLAMARNLGMLAGPRSEPTRRKCRSSRTIWDTSTRTPRIACFSAPTRLVR